MKTDGWVDGQAGGADRGADATDGKSSWAYLEHLHTLLPLMGPLLLSRINQLLFPFLILCFWILIQHRLWSLLGRKRGGRVGRKDLTVLRTASGLSLISHHLTVAQNNWSLPSPWLRPSGAADPPRPPRPRFRSEVHLNASPLQVYTQNEQRSGSCLCGIMMDFNRDPSAWKQLCQCDSCGTALPKPQDYRICQSWQRENQNHCSSCNYCSCGETPLKGSYPGRF